MLFSSLDTLLNLSKATSPQKLFDYDCVTLYVWHPIPERKALKSICSGNNAESGGRKPRQMLSGSIHVSHFLLKGH